MKKYIVSVLLLISISLLDAGMAAARNSHRQPTSFAIVVDETTYHKSNKALLAYEKAIDDDGLYTYLLHGNWENPQQIRKVLADLYKKDPTLEGIVLIGDIPIAFVRNAQHLTTAFKMDETKFPIDESSVPSDRYYDDLNLKFDFLSQDSIHPSRFYFKLRSDCEQRISPTYYSARIMYPEAMGGDKYLAISDFLSKAAAAKKRMNPADNIISFTGAGYNSECLTAWLDEGKQLREEFPAAFKRSDTFKQYDFRMNPVMRNKLLDALQRKNTDIFIFNEHGMPTRQLINNNMPDIDFDSRYTVIKNEINTDVRKALKKGEQLDSIIAYFHHKYGLLPSFFDKIRSDSVIKIDSMFYADQYISTSDLKGIKTFPEFVILNACYNGSFQDSDYVAGHYLFNDGKTLAVQGNTRNVLQDRWTTDLIGTLGCGLRVGQYNALVCSLEGHLMGDPTVRFVSDAKRMNRLTLSVTLEKGDNKTWLKCLGDKNPNVQSLGLRMLVDNHYAGDAFSKQLKKIAATSPYNIVRLEALTLLSRYANSDFTAAVKNGLTDAFELMARKSAFYAGCIGDTSLIRPMLNASLENPERIRVGFNIGGALFKFDDKIVLRYMAEQPEVPYVSEKDVDELKTAFISGSKRVNAMLATIGNKKLSIAKRISGIRFTRNCTHHPSVGSFLELIKDKTEPDILRINMIEALGWYTESIYRTEIQNGITDLLKDKSESKALSEECEQTLNRLKNY